jgi:hypothetical protein
MYYLSFRVIALGQCLHTAYFEKRSLSQQQNWNIRKAIYLYYGLRSSTSTRATQMHKPITFLLNTTALSYVPSPPWISQSKMFQIFYKNSWIPLTHKLRINWYAQIYWKTLTAQFYAFHIFVPLKVPYYCNFGLLKTFLSFIHIYFFSNLTSLNWLMNKTNSTKFCPKIHMLQKFVSVSIVNVNGKMFLILISYAVWQKAKLTQNRKWFIFLIFRKGLIICNVNGVHLSFKGSPYFCKKFSYF